MNGLNLPKVSQLMTPKERAKLVVKLVLKGFEEMSSNPDDPLLTEGEIKQVVAACPSSETKEYNFYIGLKEQLWKRVMPLIELDQNYLEIIDGRARLIRYLLTVSPATYTTLQIVKRQQSSGMSSKEEDSILLAKEHELAIGHLEGTLPFKLSDKGEDGVVHLQVTAQLISEALKNYVSEFRATVNCIHKYIAVAEKVEQDYFDGMEVLSRDPKHVCGIIPRVLVTIDDIIETHNKALKEVVEGFDLMSMGLTKHEFDGLEGFLLKSDYEVDSTAVDRKVMEIENESR